MGRKTLTQSISHEVFECCVLVRYVLFFSIPFFIEYLKCRFWSCSVLMFVCAEFSQFVKGNCAEQRSAHLLH